MTPHFLSSSLLAACFLSACTATTSGNRPYIEQQNQADIFMDNGQTKEAARLYQNLAKSNPRQQNQFRLLAAEAMIKSGEIERAKQYLNKITPASLSYPQQNQLKLLQAQITLSYGNAEQALEMLEQISVDPLQAHQQKQYFHALAFAKALSGDMLGSVKARIHLGRLLQQPEQIAKNNTAILETLLRLPRQHLIPDSSPYPDTFTGWLELASLIKQYSNKPELLTQALEQWQWNYPDHPANNNSFIEQYLAKSRKILNQPATIAVFLPESGPYKRVAAAIKTGLLAAYSRLEETSAQPALQFYDSAAENPATLYNRAISNGAELILGPLAKDNINQLASLGELPIPVLALNHVDQLYQDNLFQFGLSPLDDAAQITAKSRMEGHDKALLLTPETHSGSRIARYITDAWQQQEGTLLENQSYNPKAYDFSAPIKKILNLDESEARFRQLQRTVNRSISFTPRRRTDVNSIFIEARPANGRSLNPQLKFYHAADIPVYATSHIYTGQANPRRDGDLNGITFCDIPWIFQDFYQGNLTLTDLMSQGQSIPKKYWRLIALGIDAYSLIPYLNEMSSNAYPGATGKLMLNGENRITRQLVCARFVNGSPVAEGYIQSDPTTPTEMNIFYEE